MTEPEQTHSESRWEQAVLGALAAGVLLPCALVWLHTSGTLKAPRLMDDIDLQTLEPWNVHSLAGLLILTTILNGPVILFLSLLILWTLRAYVVSSFAVGERYVLTIGAAAGAVFAFLNLPGYAVFVYFDGDPFGILRIAALFAVTGATCGFWIGWQAYKEQHDEPTVFPRFSLFTLIAFAFGWGVLLMLFMPAR